MPIALDASGVAELRGRFGEFHDSVLRRLSCVFEKATRLEIGLDALDLAGAWWKVTFVLDDVSEFRLAEGAAIWGNETTFEVSTSHPDGTISRATKTRDLGDLRLGGPTNRIIFAAAIHVAPEGVLVDLAPSDLVAPEVETDPSEWRKSTFYVFGRAGEARVEPLAVLDSESSVGTSASGSSTTAR